MAGVPPHQTFRSRLAAVFTGELLNKACVIAAFVWIARTLEPAAYGAVEWALSVTMVAGLAADAGLSTWATARIAAVPEDAAELVGRVGWLRLALALPVYGVLLLVAATYGGAAGDALAVYGLVLLLTPCFLAYLFNGLFLSGWAALGQGLRGATFAAVVFLLVDATASPWRVGLAEVAGALVLAISNVAVLRRAVPLRVRLGPARQRLRALLADSWTVAAGELTWGVHWYCGVVLLGYVSTATETAWHAAALRLVLAAHTVVWLYLYVLLPNLARLVVVNGAAWAGALEQSLRLTAWIGCAVALATTLGAGPILRLVFGDPFLAAAPALQVMIWIVPIVWMGNHLNYSLIAAQHPGMAYRASLAGAAAATLGTLVAGPALGSTGAAVALFSGALANAVAALALARRTLPPVAVRHSVAPAALTCLACLSMGLLLRPVAGEAAAACVATASLVGVAVFTERQRAADFLHALAVERTFDAAGALPKPPDA